MPHMRVNYFGAKIARVMSDYPGICEECHVRFCYGEERYKWGYHEAHKKCFALIHKRVFGSYPMIIKANNIVEQEEI